MPKNQYSVSQNFLTSGSTIRRLMAMTDLSDQDTVVEIGAGKGHITRELSRQCANVIAYEIDPTLARRLNEALPDHVRLICGDFFKASLPRGSYKVFANIPFNHTTAILRRLTGSGHCPAAAWLIMEKGAAMRFCGICGESPSSLSLKPWWSVRIVYRLRREDFHPMPSVDCVLLELKRRHEPDLLEKDRAAWEWFVKQAMRQGIRQLLTPRQISRALKEAGCADIPMSGTLRYVQWLCLFRCWRKIYPA